MSGRRFLLRFDDIAPAMNWAMWDKIEHELRRRDIRPILAVVPDNRDPHLEIDSPREDFWHRVRQWQSWGWTIGLHGYQHVYETRRRGLVGILPTSEFAGLSEDEQGRKLDRALDIFQREHVRADVWIAPAHSFDALTLRLLKVRKIDRVSDGYYRYPIRDRNDVTWIPQQLWRFRDLPEGCWTVCYHHNAWTASQFKEWCRQIEERSAEIVSLEEALTEFPPRPLSARNWIGAQSFRTFLFLRRQLRFRLPKNNQKHKRQHLQAEAGART